MSLGGDMSGVNSLVSIKQARDQMDAARAARESAERAAQAVAGTAGQQSALADQQARQAWEQWDRYKRVFGPVEEATANAALHELDYLPALREAQAAETLRDLALARPVKDAQARATGAILDGLAPLGQRLMAEALDEDRPDFAAAESRATADVRAGFERARSRTARTALGLSGALTPERLQAALGGGDGLDEVSAEVSARARARQAEAEEAQDRQDRDVKRALSLLGEAELGRTTGKIGLSGGSDPAYARGLSLADTTRTALGLWGQAGDNLSGATRGLTDAARLLD